MAATEPTPKNLSHSLVFLKSQQTENLNDLIGSILESGYLLNVLPRDATDYDALVELNPAAILFDCTSDENTGLDTFRKFKTRGLPEQIPVLFISGDDPKLVETAWELNASDWISFPVQEKEALLRIKKNLRHSSPQEKVKSKPTNLDEARLESLLAINEYVADSIQELVDFALNEIIALTGSKIGYIYFYDQKKQEFTLNSWSKEVMDECKVLNPQTTYQLDNTGIWGEVVRQRKPIVVNDFQAPNPLKKGLPEGHVGLTRFLSIPVFDNNEIVALVGVGNKEQDYDQADIRQLTLMMNSVWAVVRKKKQERQLAESEKRFRIMYESAPLSYQSLDANACLIDVNQKWLDTLGYTRDEVIGRPFGDFMTPESAELIKNRFAHFLEAGEIHDYIFDMVRKDGTIITVSYDGNIGYDEHGNFRQTHCIFSDISEKKNIEFALRKSESRFRNFFEHSPVGKSITGIDGSMQVNPAFCRMLGYTREELATKKFTEITHPDDLALSNEYRQKMANGEIPEAEFEKRYLHKNGNVVWTNVTTFLQRDDNGNPLYFYSSVVDVTARKIAENRLRESEERFRTTLYSIGDGVITTDAMGVVQMMNPIAEQLTGWSQAEATGKTLEVVFPIINEDTRQSVEIPVRRVLREGVVVGLANHTLLIAKDGTERPIADSGAPIRNERNEIVGVVLVFRDQTAEREAERLLQESEFFFRESQRAGQIGSYNLNVTTGLWTSSEVLDQIFGIDKGYLRDVEGWENLIYPEDTAMMDHHFKVEVVGQRNPFNKEYRIVRKTDGALRWVHGLGRLILDKEGTPVSMIGTIQDITERKKAEKEIQDQNNRLNAIINAMPDLVFISDREGTYLEFFNPKSRGMLFTPEKLIGANVRDVFDQDTAALHLRKIQECLDRKELVNYEYTGNENGETIHFEGRIVPLDENRVLRFVRDITESKKLREEQFRLLNIIDHSLNEIYVFDSETLNFSYMNQGALKNIGYSPDEIKTLTPIDIKPNFDRDTFVNFISPLISGQKEKLVFETIHQRKDGTTYPVEIHLQLLGYGGKNVFFAIINDITYRKLAEAAVHESEEMFRKLAESTPMAICIYQDDKWLYTNPAGEELSGYSLKEYQDMFIWDFVAPEHQAMVKEYAKMRMEGAVQGQGYEFRIIRKNGESRWVYLKGSRINYKGKQAGLISVLDITEKKKMEDELRQSEERFRKAITEAPFPMMLHSEDEQVIALSRGWTEISGYSLSDIPTTTEWARKAYGADYTKVKQQIEKLYRLRQYVDEGEYKITTKSGEVRIWDFGSAPLGQQADGNRLVISMAKDMTDYIRAADAIKNERTLLRTVIDNLPDPIYVKDLKGRKILANKADLENIGAKSEAEVIGKTDFELFDFETAQKTFEDDLNVLKFGHPVINREEVFHLKEQKPRWLLTTKVPLTDQTGKITGLVGIGRDITLQKMAGETIQKLSKSIEQSPSSIVITDIHGKIEYVNPGFTAVTGYLPEEVAGKIPRILVPGKLPSDQFDELWRTVSTGEVWRGEFVNRKKNRVKFTESVVISPVLDEQKRVNNLLIISEDITKRKKEEKIRNVIHSITRDGSTSGSLEDFIGKLKFRLKELIDVSNFYLALYDEANDKFWLPMYNDQRDNIETFDAAKTLTAYVLRLKKPFLGTKEDITKLKQAGLVESIGDPALVWLGVPLLVGNKPVGVFAVQSYDDPGAFNEQDQEMLELVAHEISYILERMQTDKEIKHALERAEESDRLKSAFLANMSHEIRTPLNSIIGFSELLADEVFDSEQKDEFIRYIIENGNQLLRIISDILDISKIESGEIVIRKTEIPAKRVLDEVHALNVLKVENKPLQFRLSYPKNLENTTILADKERLHQIFNNLISNALKFTPEGYIQIGCTLQNEAVEFFVKDTGIGIAPQFHARIFDRFRQLENSLTRKFGGNGLGLAITKNLVELMNGNIRLESEPGKGSTFFFTVPVAQQDQNEISRTPKV